MADSYRTEGGPNKDQVQDIPGDQGAPEDVSRDRNSRRAGLFLGLAVLVGVVIYFAYFFQWTSDTDETKGKTYLSQNVPPDFAHTPRPPAPAPAPTPAPPAPEVAPPKEIMPPLDKGKAPAQTTKPVHRPDPRLSSPSQITENRTTGGEGDKGAFKVSVAEGNSASVIENMSMMMDRGTILPDCITTVKINTEILGQIVCVLSDDAWSMDHKTVLLPQYTKIVGMQTGQLGVGQERLSAGGTWATTPDGVVINLDSIFTGQLGDPGIGGEVNSRFWKRLGPALIFAAMDMATLSFSGRIGGGSATANTGQQQGPAIFLGGGAGAVRNSAAPLLEQYRNIPPVVELAQGSRIKIITRYYLDFSTAYELQKKRS